MQVFFLFPLRNFPRLSLTREETGTIIKMFSVYIIYTKSLLTFDRGKNKKKTQLNIEPGHLFLVSDLRVFSCLLRC